jgi:hypothetical protein
MKDRNQGATAEKSAALGDDDAAELERRTCEICGKSNANVAYFRAGMTAVVYRHHECDRRVAMREPSAAEEERQEWGLNKWLAEWEPWRIEPKEPVG